MANHRSSSNGRESTFSRRRMLQLAGGFTALCCAGLLGRRSVPNGRAEPATAPAAAAPGALAAQDSSNSGRTAAQPDSPLEPSHILWAHLVGLMGERPLSWQTEQIRQVVAGGSEAGDMPGDVEILDGAECLVGNRFNFKVREEFAFDIDEDVTVEIELAAQGESLPLTLIYDKGDAASGACALPLLASPERHWQTVRVGLKRARFSGIGLFGTDFSLFAPAGKIFALRNVVIHRSYATPMPSEFGSVEIRTFDADGERTPVRMGVYDSYMRLPYPSDQAVAIRRFNHLTRLLPLRDGGESWPLSNRTIFYSRGVYGARLPVGQYILVAAKGPEYRIAQRSFRIDADRTTSLDIHLQRWIDMPARGWYSGDDHIHYTRHSDHDNENLLVVTRAEDLHIANILQMGNVAQAHFRQHDWHPVHHDARTPFVLVPGQEDPRTTRRGHTISLKIKEPVRDPERYLLYHEVFAKTRAQGAVIGYAHVMDRLDESTLEGVGHRCGLALDVPFGVVDFVEVLQMGTGNTRTWFELLNLGYKMTPTAGTDYPYIDLPGAVRSYVRIAPPFDHAQWFSGLKRGETFVSNGPILELSVNGKPMGSELYVQPGEPVTVAASAMLNPDIDRLAALELIVHGEVIRSATATDGDNSLRLHHTLTAADGFWLIVRARGHKNDETASVVAMSAPVYVHVGGRGFWKPAAVPAIVAGLKQEMAKVLIPEQDYPEPVERWETREPGLRCWEAQLPQLRQRVAEATAHYDALVERALACIRSSNDRPSNDAEPPA